MAIDRLKIKPWGPRRLREIFQAFQDAINARTPVKGLGIKLDEQPTGFQISTNEAQSPSDENINAPRVTGDSGSTPSGAYAVIATEFVNVGNAGIDTEEMLFSHDIGAGRLANDGDVIRATYNLNVTPPTGGAAVILRFGANNIGGVTLVDTSDVSFEFNTVIKIDVLVMRSAANLYRYTVALLGTFYPSDTTPTGEFVRCRGQGDNGLDLSQSQFLTLWGAASNPDATPNQVIATLALIEYVPA